MRGSLDSQRREYCRTLSTFNADIECHPQQSRTKERGKEWKEKNIDAKVTSQKAETQEAEISVPDQKQSSQLKIVAEGQWGPTKEWLGATARGRFPPTAPPKFGENFRCHCVMWLQLNMVAATSTTAQPCVTWLRFPLRGSWRKPHHWGLR
jgi:hypothetical protein